MSTRRTEVAEFDHGAQYFTANEPSFIARVEAWREAGLVGEWPGRLVTLSAGASGEVEDGRARYVGTPRMSAITRHLARPLRLHTGWPVTAVRRATAGWMLLSGKGDELGPYDVVVIAVPAPQAVPLLGPAPLLAVQAEDAACSGCWAVMAAYAEPLDLPFDAAFATSAVLPWIARNSSKPGREGPEAWVLHASNVWSDANLEATPERVTQSVLAEFDQITGRSLPTPIHVLAHRWRHALPQTIIGQTCLFDERERIGACGDWCGGPRVEGAYLSGVALAQRIAALLEAG
jgi:predicted NAD/FAD-dependent oxidoreductase